MWGRRRAKRVEISWSTPPESVEDYRSRLDALGLGRQRDALAELARRGVVLEPRGEPGTAGEALSRLGGEPVLAAGTPWPEGPSGPLSLLLQVDLAQLPTPAADDLPEDGLLSFFYDAATQQAWGDLPSDRDSWAVIHTPAGAETVRRPPPDDLPEEGRFRPWAVVPRPDLTFAPWESWDVEALGLTDAHLDYARVFGEPDDVPVHRLLGHPDPVQGDMQQVCQLASNGISALGPAAYEGDASRRVSAGSGDWRLLAKVDSSEDETGMMWGDLGRVYFWIRHDDLVDRRWDRVWLAMQCG